jgi:replicative DNA helicase
MNNSENLPKPNCLGSEKAVLGCLLLEPSFMDEISSIIRPEDFASGVHRIIFEALQNIHKRHGWKIDLAFLRDDLERTDRLRAVGGIEYLAALEHEVVATDSAPEHAERIKEAATLRQLADDCQKTVAEILDGKDGTGKALEPEELIQRAQRRLYAVTDRQTSGRLRHMREPVEDVMKTIADIRAGIIKPGAIRTHYRDLDQLTFGINPGELWILGARPSVGKTSLALNIALRAAYGGAIPGPGSEDRCGVLFISLEMGRHEIAKRALGIMGGVRIRLIDTAKMGAADEEHLHYAGHILAELPFIVDDSGMQTPESIRAAVRRAKATLGSIGLVVIDYLQLARAAKRTESKRLEVEEISRSLKQLSVETGSCVLALSQLSRASEHENREPKLADLRETGALEQDADKVFLIHRPNENDPPNEKDPGRKVNCAKNRNGATGGFQLTFQPDNQRFLDAAHSCGMSQLKKSA